MRRMWVFNVGDIKQLEFITEYGLDMAWNKAIMNDHDSRHYMESWLTREFGETVGRKLVPVFETYYNLSYRCRAEGLGHTRVEEKDDSWETVNDLPWSDEAVNDYLKLSQNMEAEALRLKSMVDERHKAQYFELVEYPCRALAAMARKMLNAQLARHGKSDWSEAAKGHNDIFRLRGEYHRLLDGKWNYMAGFWTGHSMYQPIDTTKHCLPVVSNVLYRLSAKDGQYGQSCYTITDLGYSHEALSLPRGEQFTVEVPANDDSVTVVIAFVPNHPVEDDSLGAAVSIDGNIVGRMRYDTKGRSEEWKLNVECNQARRKLSIPPSSKGRRLSVTATTQGVVLDEIIIRKGG